MDPSKIEFAIIDADDFLQLDIPEKACILSPWLMEQSINQIYGWRGIGKTWFGLSLFDAVTSGKPLGPWQIEKSVPALYLDAEMAAPDTQGRFKQISSPGSRNAPLYLYSDAYARGLGIPRANLLDRKWRESLQEVLVEKGIQLLGLDNISTLAAGIDENSKQDWDVVNQWFLSLRFAGISTIFFHHTNKLGDQRGTSAREDNLDTSILLQRPSDWSAEDGAKFIVRFKKSRVRTSDLSLIQDVEFILTEANGQTAWTWGNMKTKNRFEILKMLDEGESQAEVARTLGVDRSYVNRTKGRAIEDGHLSKKGKLTQLGLNFIGSNADKN